MLERTMEGVCVVYHIQLVFMNGCMFTSEGVSLHDLCVLVLLCVHALCVVSFLRCARARSSRVHSEDRRVEEQTGG